MEPTLVISNTNELLRLYPQDIVYISADHNYSNIFMADGDKKLVVHQLGAIEEMIKNQLLSQAPIFIRIGRGFIINRQYVYYISLPKQQLVLKSPNGKQHSITVPHTPLALLKTIIEQEINKPQTP